MAEPLATPDLSSIALFAGLSPAELTELQRQLRYQEVEPNSLVVDRFDQGEEACILLDGTMKVFIDREEDDDVVLAIVGHGELIGELNLIDHLGRSASVVSLEPCKLLWLDEQTFRDALTRMPRLAENMLGILSRRLRLVNAQLASLAALSIQGRLAHQFLAFAHGYGVADKAGTIKIGVRLSEADLSGLVGATHKEIRQVLAVFQRHGYISVDGQHRFTVHDRAALERLCT
jgi:CRP/FNR family cyclic AMP-dependent transcriptional regulator